MLIGLTFLIKFVIIQDFLMLHICTFGKFSFPFKTVMTSISTLTAVIWEWNSYCTGGKTFGVQFKISTPPYSYLGCTVYSERSSPSFQCFVWLQKYSFLSWYPNLHACIFTESFRDAITHNLLHPLHILHIDWLLSGSGHQQSSDIWDLGDFS